MTNSRNTDDDQTTLNLPRQQHPSFALVGRVNKGKSTILATLVEEDRNAYVRISLIPGETIACQPTSIKIGSETLVTFIDTPGFSNAPEALAWLETHHGKNSTAARLDTVRAFVDAHRGDDHFHGECTLLEPVLAGAGILYVVDASKPFRPDFLAEMEILRWTGRPRMALLNHISADADFSGDWKIHLGEFFNLTREFNANHARFEERIRLLRQLLEIEEDSRPALEKTIRLLEQQWNQRRSEAADVIIDLLKDCLSFRTRLNVATGSIERDYQKEKAVTELKEKYSREIAELEKKHHKKLLEIYRHTVAPEIAAAAPGIGDLFADEIWQLLGLDKTQLAIGGAIAGAIGGSALDALLGGSTLGMGTLIGGTIGAAAPLLGGKSLARIKVDIPFLPAGKAAIGGVQLSAGPPRNPNFPWILLDRALLYYEHLLNRAHGRRDAFIIARNEGNRAGYTTNFTSTRRNLFQRYFTKLLKNSAPTDTDPLFDELRNILSDIEAEEN